MNNHPTFLEVNRLQEAYPEIPLEVILKQDILRLGINFSEDSCRIASGLKPKDYFIFSFDLLSLEDLRKHGDHYLHAPEEVRFFGGEFDLKPTIFHVRLNPLSPYDIILSEGKLVLRCEEKLIAEAEFHKTPDYYQSKLPSGKKTSEIAPVLEWGYLIYLTVYRLCQYWGKDEECQFCDINENYRQQKNIGREYTAVKDVKDILEALKIIADQDQVSKAITISGGSITSQLKGKNELEFYLQYVAAIKENFQKKWIVKANVEAFKLEDCRRLADAGVDIYHPNYEIWDKRLFEQFCPGKANFVGHEEWMKRIVDAAEVFEPQNVIPNFVAGVEMAQPNGYTNVKEAVNSTKNGLEFFMSKGIMPRFTTWCREPLAHLRDQAPPPLEYYVLLLQVWRETMEKYNLPAPKGYGPTGLGNAVFSVSAFMDIIRA